MPAPSAEHAPILREMFEELLQKAAGVLLVLARAEAGDLYKLDNSQVSITSVHDDAGERIRRGDAGRPGESGRSHVPRQARLVCTG